MSSTSNTVIIGAGIIGTSTAFYLSCSGHTPPSSIHLVEASPDLFASASGYAGGFLAADWFGPATAPLGALSFRLHKDLAERNHGREKWGYSRSTSTSVVENGWKRNGTGLNGHDWIMQGGSRADVKGEHEFWTGEGPSWLAKKEGQNVDVMAESGTAAQVIPKKLCEFLLDQCLQRGVNLHYPAKAISLAEDNEGSLAAIRLAKAGDEERSLPCTRVVITSGAWSPSVFNTLFPSSKLQLPITSLAGHSLVVRSPRWKLEQESKGCHAVFATDTHGFSPEIFSRIGEQIYIAGLNDASLRLPEIGKRMQPLEDAINTLKVVSREMLGLPERDEDDLEVIREGLCFRPVTRRGIPIVARIPDAKLGGLNTEEGGAGGVYVGAGHGPWGISQSLGTGQVLAEMIEGRRPSVNIDALGI